MAQVTKKYLLVVLFALGCICVVWGYWIPAKALVAQTLLERAWCTSLKEDKVVKPWPWADSWPVGRLRQDRLGIDLIILEGTSGEPLAFGPGRLEGSDQLGGKFHSVLAGHRDTSFSFLEDLRIGDTLVVESHFGEAVYRVTDTRVTPAKQLYLDGERHHALSLITCYPFHAILPGTAMRYLVTAQRS